MRACVLDMKDPSLPVAMADAFVACGYDQLLVHGVSRPGRPDDMESLFLMGAPGHRYESKARDALEMLLPCLHLTYQRVHLTEGEVESWSGGAPEGIARATARIAAPVITLREREILEWVRCGMSNLQISEQLGISALTVKNHVQKILRKLDATNRAQAVAKAMTMNMLGGSDDPPGATRGSEG